MIYHNLRMFETLLLSDYDICEGFMAKILGLLLLICILYCYVC